MSSGKTTDARLVWDLPLRLFHWLLLICLIGSWITAEVGYDARQQHLWLGYTTLGLLAFRLIWGFVGPRHARFASFFPSPKSVLSYARAMVAGRAEQTVGHNPVGSLMVFALLLSVAVQGVSGLFMDDDIMFAGPYASAAGRDLTDVMETLHHNNFYVLQALAALHILAALYLTFVKRERLIQAMFSGRKAGDLVPADQAIASSRLGVATALVAAIAGLLYWLSWY